MVGAAHDRLDGVRPVWKRRAPARGLAAAAAWVLWAAIGPSAAWSGAAGELELRVVDNDTGAPIAVRMHLWDSRGRPRPAPPAPFWKDHFVFAGKIVLQLSPGEYSFQLERGPEYHIQHGSFTIQRGAGDNKVVQMRRFVHMKQEGWWSGDLHIHRRPEDIELLMLAEDLHVAPVITWRNGKNLWGARRPLESPLVRFDGDRFYHLMAGEDERAGGKLLYFNLNEPLPLAGSWREDSSPALLLPHLRLGTGVHVDVEKPFWLGMPVWVAAGAVDSIALAHDHMLPRSIVNHEARGKPRDRALYPGLHGNALWSQDIYYRLLDCGLRIAPSAGGGSGVSSNPVGYNRVYVYCGPQLTFQKWWEGLRAGRVVVTNGPLLRPRVNGQPPGHVFRASEGEKLELDIESNLSLRDKVDYLEIVKNGRVVHPVRLDQYAKAAGRLPAVAFERSGWMLVRAVANNRETYRFASTGPYYVEIGGRPRVSKSAAQFFLDWVRDCAGRIRIEDPERREQELRLHRAAEQYWRRLLDSANAQ